jgi:hypothetical protein
MSTVENTTAESGDQSSNGKGAGQAEKNGPEVYGAFFALLL